MPKWLDSLVGGLEIAYGIGLSISGFPVLGQMLIGAGTLHFVVAGKKRLIACSDGLSYNKLGPLPGAHIKSHQAGKRTWVGHGGLSGFSGEPFDGAPGTSEVNISTHVARICGDEQLTDSPLRLVTAIRDEFAGQIEALAKAGVIDRSWRGSKVMPVDFFSAFAVKRKVWGEIEIVGLRFPVSVALDGEVRVGAPQIKIEDTSNLPLFFYSGMKMTAEELGHVDPDQDLSTDREILEWADGVFERKRQATDLVGPPYDVAVVDHVGFRWVRRQAG